MDAPFQTSLNPYAGQYGVPSATAYGSGDQNPNPNPVSTSASNPLGWAGMTQSAPWLTPNGATGQNPSFGGAGSWGPSGANGEWNNPFGMNASGSIFGLGKKYNLPDITSQSYQGTLFNPGGDYMSSMGVSPQASAQMSGQSSVQSQQAPQYQGATQYSGGQYQGASGLQSSQSFVGQSPYGVAGGTYVPNQGASSSSYGGYGNYGGYANSGSGMYVPGQ